MRFAEPVTSIERSPSHAQPVPTPPATQTIVPYTEHVSNVVSSVASTVNSSAQTGTQNQEPVLGQNALQGYSHVRGGTPPPAYLPDNASNNDISSGGSVAQVESASRTKEPAPANSVQEDVTDAASTNQVTSTATAPTTAARPAKRARAAASETGPRKAPKRNSTRSNALVQSQLEDDTVPGPSQTPRRPPVARMTATSQDPTDDATMSDATAAPKKTPAKRKPRKVKTPARVDEEEPVEGQEVEQPATKAKKPRKPRQKAAPKPRAKKAIPEGGAEGEAQDETNADEEEPESDPELHEIDPEALSMYTITKQKRYGKTSEREKKMAEIDWEEVKRKRRAEADGLSLEQAQQSNVQQKETDANASTEDAEGATATDKQDTTTRAVEGGLGFRVVNGEIVEDEETLQIDRRAQAQAEIAMQAPVEEEDELTRFHNRATYMNDRKRDEKDRVPMWKSKSDPWSEDETDRFYDALKNWGTDFMIISQLFPPKTRAQIKKKFNREERLDPERVNAALLGKDPIRAMDLNAYALAANLDVAAFNKFDSLEHAQSLISESMKDKEEAMRIAVKEAEETERQRAVHEAGKKKGREGAEERRKLAQAKKAMRSKGMVWGTGTFGGFGGGGDEEGGGE